MIKRYHTVYEDFLQHHQNYNQKDIDMTRTPLIAGNWKMNLNMGEAIDLVQAIKADIEVSKKDVDVLVAPPFTYISEVARTVDKSGILIAGQNMHWDHSGAYTGEISAYMLQDTGCTHVILGHSERRNLFGETDEIIDRKVKAAVERGLVPIVCVGETLEQREKGKTFDVIKDQLNMSLDNLKKSKSMPPSTVLAYEPVWAIGTGKTASPEQAQEVHAFIRTWLNKNFGPNIASSVRILYGGSVKPTNAAELMSQQDIDGALIGGASLKADSFIKIIHYND